MKRALVIAVLTITAAWLMPGPSGSESSPVHAGFDLGTPAGGPFPSDHFTVRDRSHNTGRRVNLPLPDCEERPSDCEDLEVINALDGFNLQPRLSIPFDGPLNVNTVTSSTLFLISLGSTVADGGDPGGTVIGINQVVWDVETNTLHVETDELLAQHTRYALIVTTRLEDAGGNPVEASDQFRRFRQTVRGDYKRALLDAIHAARRLGVREQDMATASVFTTQSATAILEKIRDQIKAAIPEPADFLLGPSGSRTLFQMDDITQIRGLRQVGVNPPAFSTPVDVNLASLRIIPGAVGGLAFGKYTSPDYEVHPGEYIPEVGTRTGSPAVQGTNEIFFNLVLPSGPKPHSGWPVAIFAPGNGGDKEFPTAAVTAFNAQHGIATIVINPVGNGWGPLSTLTVTLEGGVATTFLAGGRGIDQDGNGVIANPEGTAAAAPKVIVSNRDSLRQTAVDVIQLVRVIEVGMDVDGDSVADLDPSHVYFFGQSAGANAGTLMLAVEPGIRVAVPNVPGGPFVDNVRNTSRVGVGRRLEARVPSLLNAPGITLYGGLSVLAPHFHDNLPLRDGVELTVGLADGTNQVIRSPVINSVQGAMPIQELVDNTEWVFQSGNPVAYARHLRRDPLPGVPAKSVLIQFAKGDQVHPNPMTTTMLRAGGLAEHATFYRHDLAFAENPLLPKNPHGFVLTVGNPNFRDIALGALSQIAAFLASDGGLVIHPEPARFFEVPVVLPLPEDLNFIP